MASALKQCAQHIFSVCEDEQSNGIVALDINPDTDCEEGRQEALTLIEPFKKDGVLIFTDVIGATPSNIAHSLLDGPGVHVVTGVNLPAVITAISNCQEPLATLVALSEGAAHSGISSASARSLNKNTP